MWLKACYTNSDPKIIGHYYISKVKRLGGCPARIRMDKGTENAYVRDMQQAMRYDQQDRYAKESYLTGCSRHNQRMESWWAFLRRHQSQYWMNLFEKLRDDNLFTGDRLDKSLVQFVFMDMIQVST